MSAFMVNTEEVIGRSRDGNPCVNLDTFDGESTCRGEHSAAPTDAQKEVGS